MINVTLEKDFVTRLGQELELFKWKDSKTAVCRCPVCGDSQKNKLKTRGYFYVNPKSNSYCYKCHNCGVSMSLYSFLEEKNQTLYREMKLEYIKQKRFQESFSTSIKTVLKTVPYSPDLMQQYPSIMDLDRNHKARVYMEDERKLPMKSLMRIYYVEDFAYLANEVDKSKELKFVGDRIVFPLYTRDKKLFGVSGRCIGKESELRYITIKNQDSKHIKVYGLERYNPDNDSYCVEGALDSEFLPNCVSLTGAGSMKKNALPFSTDHMTMIFDNEPRNIHIRKFMLQSLNNGFKVCIWGKDFKYKDINEAIQNGWSREDILEYVKKNTLFGLKGKLLLGSW